MPLIIPAEFEPTTAVAVSFSGALNTNTEWQSTQQKCAYDVTAFIGYELGLVPQVENVFVSKEDEVGKVLRVTVVVDQRDAGVRAAVYAREQAIMDEMKEVDFDFHIIAREGRPLELLITEGGGGDSAL